MTRNDQDGHGRKGAFFKLAATTRQLLDDLVARGGPGTTRTSTVEKAIELHAQRAAQGAQLSGLRWVPQLLSSGRAITHAELYKLACSARQALMSQGGHTIMVAPEGWAAGMRIFAALAEKLSPDPAIDPEGYERADSFQRGCLRLRNASASVSQLAIQAQEDVKPGMSYHEMDLRPLETLLSHYKGPWDPEAIYETVQQDIPALAILAIAGAEPADRPRLLDILGDEDPPFPWLAEPGLRHLDGGSFHLDVEGATLALLGYKQPGDVALHILLHERRVRFFLRSFAEIDSLRAVLLAYEPAPQKSFSTLVRGEVCLKRISDVYTELTIGGINRCCIVLQMNDAEVIQLHGILGALYENAEWMAAIPVLSMLHGRI